MASTRWYQRISPCASDRADVLGLVSLRSFFFFFFFFFLGGGGGLRFPLRLVHASFYEGGGSE